MMIWIAIVVLLIVAALQHSLIGRLIKASRSQTQALELLNECNEKTIDSFKSIAKFMVRVNTAEIERSKGSNNE